MIMIMLASSLVGAVLGIRFRIHVMAPAVLLGLITIAIIAVVEGAAISSALATMAVYVVAMQLGYLGGLFARFCMAAARVPSHRPLDSTTVRS